MQCINGGAGLYVVGRAFYACSEVILGTISIKISFKINITHMDFIIDYFSITLIFISRFVLNPKTKTDFRLCVRVSSHMFVVML